MSDNNNNNNTSNINQHSNNSIINNKLAIPLYSQSYYQPDTNSYSYYNNINNTTNRSNSPTTSNFTNSKSSSLSSSSTYSAVSLAKLSSTTSTTTNNNNTSYINSNSNLRSSFYSPDNSYYNNTTTINSTTLINTAFHSTPIRSKMSHHRSSSNGNGTTLVESPDLSSTTSNGYAIHSPISKLHLLDPISEKTPSEFDLDLQQLPTSNSNYHLSNVLKQPKNSKILFKVIDMLAGKDKVGKVIQYALRILLWYSQNLRTSAALSKYNLTDINFNDSKTSNILVSLFKRPELLLLLLLGQFENKAAGVVKGLSMYRQMMRAGKTPFRILDLFGKIGDSINILRNSNNNVKLSTNIQTVQSQWINEKTLSELTALYYSFFDESLLFFKLGVLSSKTYKSIAERHEMLAWYVLIINGLRLEFQKLAKLNNKESSIKINYQVKQRAKALMTSMNIGSPINSPNKISLQSPGLNPSSRSVANISGGNLSSITYELNKIKKEKYLVKLEIVKLLCDFIFDSVRVFNIKMNVPLLDSFQLVAASISSYKIWLKVKEDMIEEMKSN